MTSPVTTGNEKIASFRQHIDRELSTKELGDLRTEEQVRDLFLAREANATRTQLGRAEKLKLAFCRRRRPHTDACAVDYVINLALATPFRLLRTPAIWNFLL